MYKAQSAIEYLMTYGWMLLVIAIVGGAIYSVAEDQSIENVSGFEANKISVSDYGLTNSGLTMVLTSRSPDNAMVEEINISSQDNIATVPLDEQISFGNSKNLNLPYVRDSDTTNTLDIEIKLSTENLENITVSGSITGNLQFDDSLIGYWTLSEEQGNETHIYDISQNSDHGEINDAKYISTKGKKGMKFDGEDDRIRLSGDRGSGQTDDFTVSVWAKTNESEWILGEGALFRIHTNPGDDAGFWIRSDEGWNSNMVWGGEIEENMWHNYVGVYDSSQGEQYVYIDGKEVGKDNPEFERIGNFHNNLCIAESWCGSGSFFNGTVSDVRIFNRALTPEEIKSTYEYPELIK